MDEESMIASLDVYKSQLSQVEQAIEAAGETEDLVKLKGDLSELIALTEDSLLSYKKGKLLQSLETPEQAEETSAIDDEYAAFQAALGGEVTSQVEQPKKEEASSSRTDEDENLEHSMSELEGMRCKAPFQHDWGCLAYYNALILSVDALDHDTESPMVKVMFCNPTHSSMAPCQFYLDGRCKFNDEECRNSHGYLVKLEDLKEYEEPNYSLLKLESKCLAQYEDGLWYKSTVVDIKDEVVHVMFDEYGDDCTVRLEQVMPLGNDKESSDSDSSDDGDDESYLPLDKSESEEEEDAIPVFLWRPPKTTARLGEWEEHTKGIGSKLMAQMGYITGQGLGKNGEGKADPVPIQLIPKGKSLDKIMELKEIAGDQDLFDVMKKSKKRKHKKKGVATNHNITPVKDTKGVFDFINKKLHGKKGNIQDLVLRHTVAGSSHGNNSKRNISEKELDSKSDRHLNIQLLKTDEEMKNVDKELKYLKQSLVRNQQKDKAAAKKIEAKIISLEEYQKKLKSSEQAISRHKQRRSDHKKLTIF